MVMMTLLFSIQFEKVKSFFDTKSLNELIK
jgi:hypothetical protein